ncbi:MAG: hypothetical protein QW544_03550 [Candidatus Caldarchaeum sp.]
MNRRAEAFIEFLYKCIQGLQRNSAGLTCPKCGKPLSVDEIKLACGCRVGGRRDSFS